MKSSSDIASRSLGRALEKGSEEDLAKNSQRKKSPRRNIRLLEVGAINTQLLDAAARTRTRDIPGLRNSEYQSSTNQTEHVYRLDVKALDIRSTDPRIEQMDFFDLSLPRPAQTTSTIVPDDNTPAERQPYDVIVNSMVINCLTTPAQRGKMLSLCYQHLRPGGICFLVLPKLCLIQSKFMSRSYFEEILTKGVGFEILQEVGRESPKVAFFVLRRPEKGDDKNSNLQRKWDEKFACMPVINHGKKFRNTFALILTERYVGGARNVCGKESCIS